MCALNDAVSAIEPVMLLAWFIVETNDDSRPWFARKIFHARSNGNSIYIKQVQKFDLIS